MSLDDTVQKAFDQAKAAVEAPKDDAKPVVSEDTPADGAQAEPAAEQPAATTPESEPEKVEAPAQDDEEKFFSDEDFEKLKDDPAAVRKAMQKAFTQKTQRIAEQRKLIEAFERDPVGTTRYHRSWGSTSQTPLRPKRPSL